MKFDNMDWCPRKNVENVDSEWNIALEAATLIFVKLFLKNYNLFHVKLRRFERPKESMLSELEFKSVVSIGG